MKSNRSMIFRGPCDFSRSVSAWVGTRSLFWNTKLNFACTLGPVIGRWNFFLERNFPLRPQNGSNRVSARALAKRVGADQLFMYVLFVLSISTLFLFLLLGPLSVYVFCSSHLCVIYNNGSCI